MIFDSDTDIYLKDKEKLLNLLKLWISGKYENCQGRVAGSDHDGYKRCTEKKLHELRLINSAILRAPAHAASTICYKGAYVHADIMVKRVIRSITMPLPFAVSRNEKIAKEFAANIEDHVVRNKTALIPCVFRITVPPRCPVLRMSQSNAFYKKIRNEHESITLRFLTEEEVLLCSGELRNVTYVQTEEGYPYGDNRFVVCNCSYKAKTTTLK